MVNPFMRLDDAVEFIREKATTMRLGHLGGRGETLIMQDVNTKALGNFNWPEIDPKLQNYDVDVGNLHVQSTVDNSGTRSISVSVVGTDPNRQVLSFCGESLFVKNVNGTGKTLSFHANGPVDDISLSDDGIVGKKQSVSIVHGLENITKLAVSGVNFPGSAKFTEKGRAS